MRLRSGVTGERGEAMTDMRACPECKLEVPEGANRCGHCGRRFVTGANAVRSALIFVAVLAAVFLLVWGYFTVAYN